MKGCKSTARKIILWICALGLSLTVLSILVGGCIFIGIHNADTLAVQGMLLFMMFGSFPFIMAAIMAFSLIFDFDFSL